MSKKSTCILLGILAGVVGYAFFQNYDISISNNNNKFNNPNISNTQFSKENIEHEEITTTEPTTDLSIPTEENSVEKITEIVSTELEVNNTHLPDNIKLFIDSGYPTSFGKWTNPNNSFVFHEFKTDTGNNDISRQGLYCIETKQYVLLNIKFNNYANWVIYCYDNGSLSEFAKGAEPIAYEENGWIRLEDCLSKWDKAVESLGLIPLNTLTDTCEVINQQKAFELIGYTPE